MKIDKTFKIKEKYFNAILRFEKPFELRHESIAVGSIVKLQCENGRYLIFKSGECHLLWKHNLGGCFLFYTDNRFFYPNYADEVIHHNKKICGKNYKLKAHTYITLTRDIPLFTKKVEESYIVKEFKWYDTSCWNYINEKPTYLIEIGEIIKVM